MEKLLGLHHVTAITSDAAKNYEFFTYTLGMRLVKKTVNQDDIETYHLFFADDKGNAGTDITFFDFPGIPQGTHGDNELYRIGFRVPDDKALEYWEKRFDRLNVEHSGIEEKFGKKILKFNDFDNQKYQLVSDENNYGVKGGTPWKKGPIPDEFAIIGLGPICIRFSSLDKIRVMLTDIFGFEEIANENNEYLFEVNQGGNGAQVIAQITDSDKLGIQGSGTVHHLAFRVADEKILREWIEWIGKIGLPSSGFVDRFFFKSEYIRTAKTLLFELATDGPGFLESENYETMGESLSLPPFLEERREEIESIVRPINTTRSTLNIKKEYE